MEGNQSSGKGWIATTPLHPLLDPSGQGCCLGMRPEGTGSQALCKTDQGAWRFPQVSAQDSLGHCEVVPAGGCQSQERPPGHVRQSRAKSLSPSPHASPAPFAAKTAMGRGGGRVTWWRGVRAWCVTSRRVLFPAPRLRHCAREGRALPSPPARGT